jgi:hypothetical protein
MILLYFHDSTFYSRVKSSDDNVVSYFRPSFIKDFSDKYLPVCILQDALFTEILINHIMFMDFRI